MHGSNSSSKEVSDRTKLTDSVTWFNQKCFPIGGDVKELSDDGEHGEVEVSFTYMQALQVMVYRSASMTVQVIDLLSDMYVCVALHYTREYVENEAVYKLRKPYLILIILSIGIGWGFPMYICRKLYPNNWMTFSILWIFDLNDIIVTFDAFKARIERKKLILTFPSLHRYRAESHRGAINSHSISLVFEDIPLFILNWIMLQKLGEITFVVGASLLFSAMCVMMKAYSVNFAWNASKKEIAARENLKAKAEDDMVELSDQNKA